MTQDATQVLTSDHREVEEMFARIEGAASLPIPVVKDVIRELSIHDAIEREYLYPTVREKVPGSGGPLAEHSLDEHQQVTGLLYELEKAVDDGDGARARTLLGELIPAVRAHVQEEETAIFPQMRQVMDTQHLKDLGDKLMQAKKAAPTHPHPDTPRNGVGAKVAGTVAGAVDRIKDKAGR